MGLRVVAALVMLLGCAPAVLAQGSASAARPDLSGYWELRFDSFNVPAAALTAQAQAAAEARRKKDLEAIRGCVNIGMPALMNDRATLDIRQSAGVIGMVAKSPSSTRYVYTDGRKHPDVKDPSYVPSGFGHSIGRWEGDTLVVDTIGFAPRVCDSRRPVMLVPGGGRAKDTTHLVERYRLANADELSVTFTWEDPTVFLAPHTYSYTYKRLPEGIPIENNEEAPAGPQPKYITDQVEK